MIERIAGLKFDAVAMMEHLRSLNFQAPSVYDYQISVNLPAAIASQQQPPLIYYAAKNLDLATGEYLVQEDAFDTLSPYFTLSPFEEVYETISANYHIGRARILAMNQKTAYALHTDKEEYRLHIPLQTNPGAMLVWELPDGSISGGRMPEPGQVYIFKTSLPHTAMNASYQPRFHLVFNLLS